MSVGILGHPFLGCAVIAGPQVLPAATPGGIAPAWNGIITDEGGFCPGGVPAAPIVPVGGAGWYQITASLVGSSADVPTDAITAAGWSNSGGLSVIPGALGKVPIVSSSSDVRFLSDGDVVSPELGNSDPLNDAMGVETILELVRLRR